MPLEIESEEFKRFFLLAFTRELIRNAIPEVFVKLEVAEEVRKQEIKERTKEIVRQYEEPLNLTPVQQLEAITQPGFKPLPKPFEIRPRRRLMIPQPRLPQRLQYIQPAPSNIQLDLGKLNPLIQDSAVQSIECNGAEETILVRVPMERNTGILLTNEEIDDIIYRFSEAAKIPITEGIFRVAVGKLILSAIVSSVIGSKFIIKKMRILPGIIPQTIF